MINSKLLDNFISKAKPSSNNLSPSPLINNLSNKNFQDININTLVNHNKNLNSDETKFNINIPDDQILVQNMKLEDEASTFFKPIDSIPKRFDSAGMNIEEDDFEKS